MNATPALPALVATSHNVQLHNATQIHVSSGSEISVASSIERQRRFDLARAKRELAELRVREANELARAERELAEARVAEAQSRLDLSASSHAGSIGRLGDVASEGGSSDRARRTTDVSACPPKGSLLHTTYVPQPTDPSEVLYSNVVQRLLPTEATTNLPGVSLPKGRFPQKPT